MGTCKQDKVSHDFENLIKKGKVIWICPVCNEDVSFQYICMTLATADDPEDILDLACDVSDIEKTGEDYVVNKLVD